MSVEALRLFERIHGHLGWLTFAALLHPAIVLRNPLRRARLSTSLATAITATTFAIGAIIYTDYSRGGLRHDMYTASRFYGVLFERKEHLAIGVLGFAIAGWLVHVFAFDRSRPSRARFAHLAFMAAAALDFLVSAFGTAISAFKSW